MIHVTTILSKSPQDWSQKKLLEILQWNTAREFPR